MRSRSQLGHDSAPRFWNVRFCCKAARLEADRDFITMHSLLNCLQSVQCRDNGRVGDLWGIGQHQRTWQTRQARHTGLFEQHISITIFTTSPHGTTVQNPPKLLVPSTILLSGKRATTRRHTLALTFRCPTIANSPTRRWMAGWMMGKLPKAHLSKEGGIAHSAHALSTTA